MFRYLFRKKNAKKNYKSWHNSEHKTTRYRIKELELCIDDQQAKLGIIFDSLTKQQKKKINDKYPKLLF